MSSVTSVRTLALAAALATVGTLGFAGPTSTDAEAHGLRRHHHHRFVAFGYRPYAYVSAYEPCGWVWTRRGKFWYCY
jgi:hypothetical protein